MRLLQVEVIPVPSFPPEVGAVMMFQEIVLPLIGIAFGGLVVWGAFRTLNRFLERRQGGVPLDALHREVEALKAKADAMEDLALRVGEMEERIDFAERLLTQQQHGRLNPGG